MPLLLCFGEELRLRAARRVAACRGYDVEFESEAARIVSLTAELSPDLVLVDLDHAGDLAVELARHLYETVERPLILVANPSPPECITELLGQPWMRHLLALESPWFMDELGATLAKLEGADIFGLHCYLPWSTRFFQLRITGSKDKDAVFEHIERFMSSLGVRGRLVHHLNAIADELLMNAIYDAPIDRGTGKFRYAEWSRQKTVELEPDERPSLYFGSDGRVFGIGISDPFGGLTPDVLKRYVGKGLRRGADQIDDKAGGAGLGLFFLYDRFNSMVLNLSEGRRTEVMGLVDIRGSFRAMRQTPKSFSIFTQDPFK